MKYLIKARYRKHDIEVGKTRDEYLAIAMGHFVSRTRGVFTRVYFDDKLIARFNRSGGRLV